MTRDAYGYPTDPALPPRSGGGALLVSLLIWSMIAVCTGVPAVLIGLTTQDRDIDRLGVGVMTSVCAWPAAATAIWSVLLYLGARQRWTQLGPNVVLGCVTGGLVWLVLFCGIAMVAGQTQ